MRPARSDRHCPLITVGPQWWWYACGTALRDRHLAHYLALALRHHLGMAAELAARELLGPDKTNVAAAFEWAASKQDWTTAARLLLGCFAVFHAYPTEGIALVDRCLTHMAEDEHDLAMRLVHNQWILLGLISDVAAVLAATRLLRDSPTPLAQVYGYGLLSVQVAMTDRVKAAEIFQRSHEVLQTLPAGPDTTQAAAAYAVWAGLLALFSAEFDVALQYAQQALALQGELGYETEFSAHASMLEAVSALLAGDPGTALEAANRYARLSLALGTGDEIKALVHVAFGDLESARTAAKAHAQVAITGRVPNQATESLLVLAALAEAEGDLPTARDLITNAGRFGQYQLLSYASQLARRLGVNPDFEAAQRFVYVLDEHVARQRASNATQTLRHEMTRRGWH